MSKPPRPEPAYAPDSAPVSVQNVVTIQRTAKRWKSHIALSSTAFAVGIIMVGVSDPGSDAMTTGVCITPIAMFWHLWARIMIWWHHE